MIFSIEKAYIYSDIRLFLLCFSRFYSIGVAVFCGSLSSCWAGVGACVLSGGPTSPCGEAAGSVPCVIPGEAGLLGSDEFPQPANSSVHRHTAHSSRNHLLIVYTSHILNLRLVCACARLAIRPYNLARRTREASPLQPKRLAHPCCYRLKTAQSLPLCVCM